MTIMPLPFQTTLVEALPYRTINGQTLFLDLVRPDPLPPGPLPVVIYIFGSGWAEARRQDAEQNPAQWLAAHAGVCVASIDYRLSSQAIFPAQIADARAAVRWLRAHAQAYHLDPTRMGVWGYSSGGYLASLLGIAAAEPSFDDSPDLAEFSCQVQAVFTVSGPVDFLTLGTWHNDPDSAEARLIGGPVQENVELVRRANPLSYMSSRGSIPPFHLTHGERDEIVLISQSQLLYEALSAAGVDATFLTLPAAGHAIGSSTPYWEKVNQAAQTFFRKYLRLDTL
jgi:acetyl esterase/lipase